MAILRWMDEWLSDRERGGFYASQDADDSLDDDGDYFTWTREEVQAVLPAEEFRVAEAYFNVRPMGDMHHNPAKNVLHTPKTLEEVAKALGIDEVKARELLRAAKEKMYAARLKRRTPYVDKTVYTGWNGMCISAYIAAGRCVGFAGAGGVCAEVAGSRAARGVERCGAGACGGVWRGCGAGARGGGRARRLCVCGECGAGRVGGER